ncbi:hypothetical protein [Adlercreutzia sp. ZJ473]|uniref:hypothetical protein n=1 Tax=Adlercreutzia sp. ZJ473 TaxID=2722822 RepID=UPI00155524C0|nr:hypothetical protein [Adlercreutzia sp. ZJ473]
MTPSETSDLHAIDRISATDRTASDTAGSSAASTNHANRSAADSAANGTDGSATAAANAARNAPRLETIDRINATRDDLEGLAALAMALGASEMHAPEALSFIARTLERCALELNDVRDALSDNSGGAPYP